MQQLSNYEFDITKELFSISLANAADAFSKMANEKVLLQGFEAKFIEMDDLNAIVKQFSEEKVYILRTEIKGKLRGRTYLLFHQKDIQTIFKIFAPPAVHEMAADGQLTDIQQDILLELDNILSAAMVTQLSNFLDIFIYGDIPKYSYFNNQKLTNLFAKDMKAFESILHIQTSLQSFHTNMSPAFFCFFEENFITITKDIIQNKKEKVLLKIKKSKEQKI
ncbi:MAG: chemotaxis protein CheC [Thermonemataceae bacterium]